MFVCQCQLNVDSGQKCKYVCLEDRHQNLKEGKGKTKQQGSCSEELEDSFSLEKEEVSCRETQHQKKVSRITKMTDDQMMS